MLLLSYAHGQTEPQLRFGDLAGGAATRVVAVRCLTTAPAPLAVTLDVQEVMHDLATALDIADARQVFHADMGALTSPEPVRITGVFKFCDGELCTSCACNINTPPGSRSANVARCSRRLFFEVEILATDQWKLREGSRPACSSLHWTALVPILCGRRRSWQNSAA